MQNINPLKEIKEKIARKTEKAGIGFRVHSTVFVAVNAFLFFLNMTTSRGFPWFYFPLAGWGIGLLCHLGQLLNLRFKEQQISTIKECTGEQYKLFRNLLNTITGFREHAVAFLAVNGFLLGTNLITSAHYPWFLYPLGGWAIGFLSHWAAASGRKRVLIARLKEQGIVWQETKAGLFSFHSRSEAVVVGRPGSARDREVLMQAEEIKEFLLQQGETNKEIKNQLKEEVYPLLDKFVKQIGELVNLKGEVTEALDVVSETELQAEIRNLKERQTQTTNSLLLREYENSLKQYEHHKQSVDELKNHKELIELRLNSSLTALKQLKLDMARLKSATSLEEPYSLKELKNKSEELSDYLADLRESYKELDIK